MRAEVTIPNGFTPRAYQQRYMSYFDNGGKRAFWVVHRRGGKDLTSMHQTVKMMLQRRGAYWHIYPTAEQGKKAIWEGFTKDGDRIMEQVFPASIRKTPKTFAPNGEMVIELKCGSIWRLMGSDKLEVVGAGPIGVVLSEYALAKPKTWDLIRPMLRENDGWASFVTTPRGKNHAWKLMLAAQKDPSWFVELLTLWDTRAYDPEATIKEERALGMPEPLIQQEFFCDFEAALVGSVWGDLLESIEKRGDVGPFDLSTDETFTSWDLGYTDATSIWFWQINKSTGGIDVVDHYESHGKGLAHYFGVIRDKANEFGYKYIKHWLPHDARANTLVSAVSIQDQAMAALGSGKVAITPRLDKQDGIQAGRRLLLHPGTRFHSRCADGLEALKSYRYEYDEEKKAFRKHPLHDWSSHSADGFRYLAVVAVVSKAMSKRVEEKPRLSQPPTEPTVTLDELWEYAER